MRLQSVPIVQPSASRMREYVLVETTSVNFLPSFHLQ
ncbi:hypothetical protein B566_EDAN005987, partial [Ephemera danica]